MKKIIILFIISALLAYADNSGDDDDDGGDKFDDIERDAENGGDYEPLIDAVVFLIIHSPELFIGMADLLFGVSGEEGDYGYSKYPYYYESDGLYSESSTFTRAGNAKVSYLYESIDYGAYQIETTLYPTKYLSLDVSAKNYYSNVGLESNQMAVVDVYLNWQRARYNNFDLRWGLGVKSIENDRRNLGLGYNIAFDIYGIKPISIGFQYTGAFINAAYFNELNLDLNYHHRNLVIFVGYDYFGSASTSINSIKMGAGFYF